jgi:hypothetical protein
MFAPQHTLRWTTIPVLAFLATTRLFAQCPNDNSSIGGTLTIPCPGTYSPSPCLEPGEYVRVNVTNGSTYTFTTCGNDDFNTNITLRNNAGGPALAWSNDACGNQSSVTWTATFTGVVRVLMDRGGNCSHTGNNCTPVRITCSSPPPNNEPCGAIALSVNAGCTPLVIPPNNTAATSTPSIPAPGCAGYSGGDVWFSLIVPASGSFSVTTLEEDDSPFHDSGMAFYTSSNGTCSGTFTLVAGSCNDDIDFPFNEMSSATITTVAAGTRVFVRVWARDNAQFGPFNICATNLPGNEVCSATPVAVENTCVFSNFTSSGASRSTNPANTSTATCPWNDSGVGASKDVWFKFIAPPNGRVIIQTSAGSLTNGIMAVYTSSNGNCSGGTWSKLTCDDNSGPGNMPLIDRSGLTPGVSYWIRFWGNNGSTGTFNLCIFSPIGAQSADCAGSVSVCDGGTVSNNSYTTGDSDDLNSANRGCLESGEMQGSWFAYQAAASGSLGFSITPTGSDDYDFAVWGPFPSGSTTSSICVPSSGPIRCSYAGPFSTYSQTGGYATGMGHATTSFNNPRFATATPPRQEDASGNGWVSGIQVSTGQVFLLYVDNYTQSGSAFQLDWFMLNSAGQPASDLLNCVVLPVELIDLRATPSGSQVMVDWTTASEHLSDHFRVERSLDNLEFSPLGTMAAAGESVQRRDYRFVDPAPQRGANYYRLQQVDQDGATTPSHVVVAYMLSGADAPLLFPNPVDSRLNVAFPMPQDGDAMVQVLDATGRSVDMQHFHLQRGPAQVALELAQLAPGCYSISVLTATGPVSAAAGFVKR